VKRYLEKFDDSLLRMQLWSDIYQMVRDGVIKGTVFLELVQSKIQFEKDPKLVQSVLDRANRVLNNFLPKELKLSESRNLFNLAHSQCKEAKNQEWFLIWSMVAVNFVRHQDQAQILAEYVANNNRKIGHFALTQRECWSIVQLAMAWSLENRNDLLVAEFARDQSERGEQAKRKAASSEWSATVKAQAWERYQSESKDSLHMIDADMGGFMWSHQEDILKPYVNHFFNSVHRVMTERNREFSHAYFDHLLPNFGPEDSVLQRLQELEQKLSPDLKMPKRWVKEAIDDILRMQKCLRLFAPSAPTHNLLGLGLGASSVVLALCSLVGLFLVRKKLFR